VEAEVRLYDRFFTKENPDEKEDGKTFLDFINPNSLEVLTGCRLEPSLALVAPGNSVQFERLGYFCADSKDHGADRPVFNRTVTLRDAWAKIARK
jgi:glutaminyl-tRNA synthetase